MRYAIISDIHGNTIALDAVLAQVKDVDAYLILGDLAALGADPIGALERLRALPNAYFVKGNTDHYICNHYEDYPTPSIEESLHDAEKIHTLAEISRSFAWTQGMISAAGHFDWLAALPTENRLTLPDGRQVLLVHSRPKHYDGEGLIPILSDEEVAKEFACKEDIILVGHTHYPQQRRVNGKHIVNPGSVANPPLKALVARYAILYANEYGYDIQLHEASYDVEAVLAQIKAAHHPTPEYLAHFYESGFIPTWYAQWKENS